ncbi:SMC-Scp complex subunit ScpB [Enterococcus timonensis]|uniref:SMC-Scp complex subunit ScpB n=1 Tax=Enterococcus timonensis TaxID=1852364 RepID=UPI0008DAEB59|nr:SMC-Scp complex subunit ScpB [Enterococcus timonensis]
MVKNFGPQLEALLFVAGEKGLQVKEAASVLNKDSSALFQQLEQLQSQYEADKNRGLTIIQTGEVFKLVTKPKFQPLIVNYAKAPIANRLSKAALETLAIVAYKQPMTRGEIDDIRGVQSSGALQTLVIKRLVEEKGRAETVGRAILYGTTSYFLDYFGLKKLTDLPDITEMESNIPQVNDLFARQTNDQENSWSETEEN